MFELNRRQMLRAAALSTLAAGRVSRPARAAVPLVQIPGERPPRVEGIRPLNPRDRVPVSLIIDDSTCLVNLAHFAIPQFAEVFPDQYLQDWRALPREIPDSFVRKFAAWCRDHHIKGKYSLVPYPACVGWLDRDIPGWTRADLEASLALVREEITPDWDIHPEMISHTWAIDTRTGRPYPERSEKFMENWGYSAGKSADELTDYLAYALRILKNVGFDCQGITTPGGFGNRVLPELARASLQALRDVNQTEIPHYFRHLYTDDQSVAPRVEYAAGLDTDDPRCVVSIIGCTGDWFGGWDGLEIGTTDQFITEDGKAGRLPEIIDRGEPAILVCHWPGIYCNGAETGFGIFQQTVARLEEHHPNVLWMKLADIAGYWAARELTRLSFSPGGVDIQAPYGCNDFTMEIDLSDAEQAGAPRHVKIPGLGRRERFTFFNRIKSRAELRRDTYLLEADRLIACFDLPRGTSQFHWT